MIISKPYLSLANNQASLPGEVLQQGLTTKNHHGLEKGVFLALLNVQTKRNNNNQL